VSPISACRNTDGGWLFLSSFGKRINIGVKNCLRLKRSMMRREWKNICENLDDDELKNLA
jgi:hypothetical protein